MFSVKYCNEFKPELFLAGKVIKGVLNPNFRPFSFELKKKKIF